jgi:hypothetical protein
LIWVFLIIFAILGAVALVAALFGLIAARRSRRAIIVMHLIALTLIITSWAFGHTELVGRVSLAAAIALEVLAWMVFRADTARAQALSRLSAGPLFAAKRDTHMPNKSDAEIEFGEPIYDDDLESPGARPIDGAVDSSTVAIEPDEIGDRTGHWESADSVEDAAASEERRAVPEVAPQVSSSVDSSPERLAANDREICVRSYALLSRPYHVSLSVLLASMKRAGARDARRIEPDRADAPEFIEWRGLKIGLDVFESPVASASLVETLAESGAADELVQAVRSHEAHIAIDVVYDHQVARPIAIASALHAHAALMEFAPVVAVWWNAGLRLIAAAEVADRATAIEADSRAALETCLTRRRFELDETNAGLVLLDSVGLRAFGLPDAQVIVPLDAATRAADLIDEIAGHLIDRGCDLPDGGKYAATDESDWRVAYRRSAFAPDREVIQLRPVDSAEPIETND